MQKNWREEHLKKVINPLNIEEVVRKIREKGKTIVTLNGSFDLLHAGHLHIIYEASKLGDVLIVALNSDESIGKNKGKNRPIIPLKYRMEMMAALVFVDFVTWFDETDPRALLLKIRPNVHVNGADYGKGCIEADVVKSCGGTIHIVDFIEGLSSSYIIEKIKKCV